MLYFLHSMLQGMLKLISNYLHALAGQYMSGDCSAELLQKDRKRAVTRSGPYQNLKGIEPLEAAPSPCLVQGLQIRSFCAVLCHIVPLPIRLGRLHACQDCRPGCLPPHL